MKKGIVRGAWLSLAFAATSLVGCVTEPTEDPEPTSDVLLGTEDLVAIPRATTVEEMVARTTKNLRSNGSGSFYLAIRKSALGERWFWSTYLEQLQPFGPNPASLGTRVVRFREQNGKLFVFNADDRLATSDVFESELIIDAFDIVDSNSFNALPGSGGFILIDPAAGQNRFGAMADWFAAGALGPSIKLETELSFVEDFKAWNDGGSFAHIFAAYTDIPLDSGSPDHDEFRVAATTRVTLRRYSETPGYTPTPNPGIPHFFTAESFNWDRPSVQQNAIKWAIKPGMQPIKWKIGRAITDIQADPIYGGADLYGAVKRGIESWNAAFGFTVFEASLAGPNDRIGDDHNNFFIIDPDPRLGYAYADWRINPNTNEVRGATVYLGGAFFYPGFPDDVDAASAKPLAKTKIPMLTWQDQKSSPMCIRWARQWEKELANSPTQLTGPQKLEAYVQETVVHEIGHTLGLRHNFEGSLVPPTSSVMDYNTVDVSFVQPVPGPYDVQALQYLYGMSPSLPTYPFCTDDDLAFNPNCVQFDAPSPSPLTEYQIPQYQMVAGWFLDGLLSSADADLYLAYYGSELMGYARAGDPVESPTAWNALTGGVCDYAGPNAGADAVCGYWFRQLVTPTQGNITVDPSDAGTLAQIAATGSATIANADRDFSVRRAAVDALKHAQNVDAYTALLEARATLAAQLTVATGAQAALTRDLLARVDAATTPYFD